VAVADTDRDRSGHVRRGNEWVVGGRLEDARFFWRADRRSRLEDRAPALAQVVFHADCGSYADKARRMGALARALAQRLGLEAVAAAACARAAELAKCDLVTGTVGEFPELQGRVGGLLLAAEGQGPELARGVYEHYQPAGPEDAVAPSIEGGVVAVADKLDTIAELIRAGHTPTGSRDPFGLRRASSGLFRTTIEKGWSVSLNDLTGLVRQAPEGLHAFLCDRLGKYLRDAGYTPNEIQAVFRPNVDPAEAFGWPLGDVVARLEALRGVRSREDFAHLVDLTKRVDNILIKGTETFEAAAAAGRGGEFRETAAAAVRLQEMVERHAGEMSEMEAQSRYVDAVGILARFVDPVERFFDDVLVLDPDDPAATLHRRELLSNLRGVLTRCFDIRELAGQADRRSA
jgi:glycyl-tRNA synthetase beta chain